MNPPLDCSRELMGSEGQQIRGQSGRAEKDMDRPSDDAPVIPRDQPIGMKEDDKTTEPSACSGEGITETTASGSSREQWHENIHDPREPKNDGRQTDTSREDDIVVDSAARTLNSADVTASGDSVRRGDGAGDNNARGGNDGTFADGAATIHTMTLSSTPADETVGEDKQDSTTKTAYPSSIHSGDMSSAAAESPEAKRPAREDRSTEVADITCSDILPESTALPPEESSRATVKEQEGHRGNNLPERLPVPSDESPAAAAGQPPTAAKFSPAIGAEAASVSSDAGAGEEDVVRSKLEQPEQLQPFSDSLQAQALAEAGRAQAALQATASKAAGIVGGAGGAVTGAAALAAAAAGAAAAKAAAKAGEAFALTDRDSSGEGGCSALGDESSLWRRLEAPHMTSIMDVMHNKTVNPAWFRATYGEPRRAV